MTPPPHADEETRCYPEAGLAGTLALMTCHAQCHEAPCRDELARHVVRNLSKLSEHPMLSEDFRSMLRGLRARWEIQLRNQAESARFAGLSRDEDTALWMPAPPHVQ